MEFTPSSLSVGGAQAPAELVSGQPFNAVKGLAFDLHATALPLH